jgi:asparagine synthase (glutamine-hydrolysing)
MADALSPASLADAGVFDPAAVAHLWQKLRDRQHSHQLSNTDNMALTGVLSTQLLHRQLVSAAPEAGTPSPTTLVDELSVAM